MPCDRIRAQLTAYLDGELDGDRGTLVRGHLRGCADCRQVATDEAALRDGLRALPAQDPPSSMWAGVQARLAAAEVAESRRPAWRRLVSRWAAMIPSFPRLATGGLVVAAAVTVIWWKSQPAPSDETQRTVVIDNRPPLYGAEGHKPVTPPLAPVSPSALLAPSADDVTADIASEPARITASYTAAADELMTLARDARTSWSDDRKAAFDDKVKTLRATIANAAEGRPRQRATRTLIRYLEGAVIREDISLASGGIR
jgi:hypothetical protein